ncbi:uncharacterized protein (DUF2345 family) [Pantoea coffeiphila]|nr:DUF2345 domain-containing protein [Pantoea coffeiphila]MBM7344023.1 uncharacterized protein (DUF2345 family) [Pantoea coffeiphila]
MKQTLSDLKQSALLLSAPEGIALSTPKSVQVSTGENVISTSGKHSDFSAMKRINVTPEVLLMSHSPPMAAQKPGLTGGDGA